MSELGRPLTLDEAKERIRGLARNEMQRLVKESGVELSEFDRGNPTVLMKTVLRSYQVEGSPGDFRFPRGSRMNHGDDLKELA